MSSYKYCVVPMCSNTTIKTPNKIFLNFPKNPVMRAKWSFAMKTDLLTNKPLSVKSHHDCCEDHFNLEEDTQNYMRYKMMGGNLLLKKNVIPHIFACQNKTSELLAMDSDPETAILVAPNYRLQDVATQTDILVDDKAVQVGPLIKVRSKGTSASTVQVNVACSPLKCQTVNEMIPAKKVCVRLHMSSSDDTDILSSEPEAIYPNSSSADSDYDDSNFSGFDTQMRTATLCSIKRKPRLCLGIPKQWYHIIALLASKTPALPVHIMLTFKKIRLDDSFAILALQFGMSISSVSRIFMKTVVLIDKYMKNLIFWPSANKLKLHLPISFRARYSNVQSIIDCLEIQINKPINPIHQSLTWSEYKGCNTLKYLVSCTPDGLVNFISCGYGGRASDSVIVEDCGYLDNLRPGMSVMADRGFKNIAHILLLHDCLLIRPPSVSANIKSTPQEVKESKRIAALRIHVERVISRIREFKMCKMHASVHHNHIPIMDEVVRIVCGLVNLQDELLKM